MNTTEKGGRFLCRDKLAIFCVNLLNCTVVPKVYQKFPSAFSVHDVSIFMLFSVPKLQNMMVLLLV